MNSADDESSRLPEPRSRIRPGDGEAGDRGAGAGGAKGAGLGRSAAAGLTPSQDRGSGRMPDVRSAPRAGTASGRSDFVTSGPPLWSLRIRETIPPWLSWLLGALPVAVLLGIWFALTTGEAESRVISPTILPNPVEVVRSLPSLWFERALMRNLLVSFGRVLEGFCLAVAIVFPLGLFMGSFTKVRAAFTPLSVFGAYLPIPTLVPLTLSLFGTGELQKVVFLGLAFGIYLLPLVVSAVDGVDDILLKTAYTLGAGRGQAVRKVLLPVAWPQIYESMRLGFGVGWSYILLAEMVDIGKGLGGIIIVSQRRGPREHIYLVLLIIVAVAFLVDKAWVTIGRRIFPYRARI